MLTKEQIEAARNMLVALKTGSEDEAAEELAEDDYHEERADNAREALEDAVVLADALTALASYERVVALLACVKPVRSKSAFDCATAADWYDKGKEEAYEEVRRAVEG